jgi:hypothetical protein
MCQLCNILLLFCRICQIVGVTVKERVENVEGRSVSSHSLPYKLCVYFINLFVLELFLLLLLLFLFECFFNI